MGRAYLYSPSKQDLSALQIRQVANVLFRNTVDPDQRMIGNYRLNQDWMSCYGFDVCTAEHMTIKGRRARVKHYKATGYRSKAELQQAVQRFERDIQALESLAPHPHIVRAYDFFADPYSDDAYWLFLEWVDGQTLQDRLSNTGSPPFAEQLSILQSLTQALEACHAQGILHRNITPASIFLTDDGMVKLGDFDLARVPGVGATVSTTGASAAINKYMAPESRDSFRAVDARADVYALGAVWYDMALPQPPEVVLPPLVDQAVLSADAKDLLRSLIAPQPADRPASAKEVREWLSLLI
jgi:serine/threonine-protein kinase